jgi:nitronate monooxygenase
MSLRTPLCGLLGIEHPILQAGMAGAAGPELVAAVSNAGALGILPGLNLPPDQLRVQIQKIRTLTDKPFGVNLWLHSDMWPPADASRVPAATVAAVRTALNGLRARLGLSPSTAAPTSSPDIVGAAFEVILETRAPVFTAAVGEPSADMVNRCHERGMKVIAMINTTRQARVVEGVGVDAIVAQGSEAGGHRSLRVKPDRAGAEGIGTLALVPQVVDAVSVPVIAAGGIADGRGIAAALLLGASAVQIGTAYLLCPEALTSPVHRRALAGGPVDDTVLTNVFTGRPARGRRNRLIDELGPMSSDAPAFPTASAAVAPLRAAAEKGGSGDFSPLWSGQAGVMTSDIPAEDLTRELMTSARRLLAP